MVLPVLVAGCEIEPEKVDPPVPVTFPETGDTGEPDVDNDGDGFVASVDCDDDDPAINPDAIEICDGIDNDCTVEIDDGEGVASISTDEGDTLFATLDEAIAVALETPGETVDICGGEQTLSSLELGTGADLTLNGVSGRDVTTLSVDGGFTVATLSDDAALRVVGVTVTGSVQRAFVLEDATTLTLTDSLVSANPGGGVLITEGSEGVSLNVVGSTFDGNVTTRSGGAILAEGRTFEIDVTESANNTSRFSNNGALRGGAIALVNRAGALQAERILEMGADTGIVFNTATERGGAIFAQVATIQLDGVTFDGNAATDAGGALDLASSVVNATEAVVRANLSAIGAGLSLDDIGLSQFVGDGENIAFVENVATEVGGAISGAGFVSGVTMARNEAGLGGAVYVPSGAFLTLEAASLDANLGIQGGALFCADNTDVDLLDVTLTLNEAVPQFFAPGPTTMPPTPLPLPDVVEPTYAGLGGAAFLAIGAELTATNTDFGIDLSADGGIDNDNRPGDVFSRAFESNASHSNLEGSVDAICSDVGCVLIQS